MTAEEDAIYSPDDPRYNPHFDKDAFDKMIEDGTKAWSDVHDAAEWVRKLRDGDNTE